MESDLNDKIHELQMFEQNMSSLLMQKQSVQVEVQEISNALQELEKSNDGVYKIISGMMIKSDKNKVQTELEEKKKLFDLRISSIEKQEKIISDKIEKYREEINKDMPQNK